MIVVVDIFKDIALAIKDSLGLPVLNFQYGYIKELNETLSQYSKTSEFSELKFPIMYLAQPFTIKRVNPKFFGTLRDLQILLINKSNVNLKAKGRMDVNYKPVLYPLYEQLIKELNSNPAFSVDVAVPHDVTDIYFWGSAQQTILDDIVDVMNITNLQLTLNLKTNCTPFKN